MEHNNECGCGHCHEPENVCEKKSECICRCRNKSCCGKGTTGAIYGLAFVGAVIYFIQQATTFWMGVLGVLKALIWPAMIIYKLLQFLGM